MGCIISKRTSASFGQQLEICGVEFFDFYLMHAQDTNIFKQCRAYELAMELLKEEAEDDLTGKGDHVGCRHLVHTISFIFMTNLHNNLQQNAYVQKKTIVV